jgi:hypothetical protein
VCAVPTQIGAAVGSSALLSLSACVDAANAPAVLTVDVQTRASSTPSWYGKGSVNIASAGCAVRTVTVTVANTIPSGASITLHAWLVSQTNSVKSSPWTYLTTQLDTDIAVATTPSGGGGDTGGGGGNPAPPSSTNYATSAAVGKYSYASALSVSLRFYETQRAGVLPASNRISFRGDSVTHDGSDAGLDLSKGWFDAGDHVKFSFPMAYSVHMLCMGVRSYRKGYAAANQLTEVLAQIRWATDFFIASHPSANVLVAQVGNGDTDHAYWGRPEQLEQSSSGMPRPTYKLDSSKPGSDLAGAIAAALASYSVIVRSTDATYADLCLQHAKDIYSFGKTYLGTYSQSVPNANGFYASGSYHDDLTLAAAWLHVASTMTSGASTSTYLTEAEQRWSAQGLGTQVWSASWDSVAPVASSLLWQITGKSVYATHIEAFVSPWLPGGSLPKTPKGLAFRDGYGSLRYATTTAFVALMYSDTIYSSTASGAKAKAQSYHDFAVAQIHYALGDTGRSYLVGFGTNYPLQPHHRAASCPSPMTSPCGWNEYNINAPNPHVLVGALVGGPSADDSYTDSRGDYVHNEITTDYNAGFTGALARLALEVAGPSTIAPGTDTTDNQGELIPEQAPAENGGDGTSSSSSGSNSNSSSSSTGVGDDGDISAATTSASPQSTQLVAVLLAALLAAVAWLQ